MSNGGRGLPLLSGPPPDPTPGVEPTNCMRCNKEFNFLFARPKRCNHCGYAYCSSCTEFQALMPRTGPNGNGSGYDPLPVCTNCAEKLTITASSKASLREYSVQKLKAYMKAYNIEAGTAVEKDELVEAIIRARGDDGCLHPQYEEYYRKHSVPHRNAERKSKNIFSRFTSNDSGSSSTARPSPQPQRQYAPPPGPPPASGYPGGFRPAGYPSHHPGGYPPYPQGHPPQGYAPYVQGHPPTHGGYQASPHPTPSQYPSYQQHQSPPRSASRPASPPRFPQPQTYPTRTGPNLRTSASHTNLRPSASTNSSASTAQPPRQPPPRPRSAAPNVSRSPPKPPRPPTPTLDALLDMNNDEISHLPIGALKSILFKNRVSTSIGVLEKQDLVKKVVALVIDERLEQERKERQEREEQERMEWARQERQREEAKRREEAREREELRQRMADAHLDDSQDTTSAPKPSTPPQASASPPPPAPTDDGLCVVCQDEHANMAIIDCGHLALCKSCSETIMQTSRECPLCRTRIVTEQRLLRIFKS